MGILHIGSFAKQSIRFIKKQNPVFIFGFFKDLFHIFFCLTYIFGYDLGKVYTINILFKLFPEQSGRQSFSCPGWAIKQGPVTWFGSFVHSPILKENLVVK